MWITLVIMLVLVVLLVVTALIEKRMAWPYGPLEPVRPHDDPSGYANRRIQEALEQGFRFLGWSQDLKGANYKVCYAFMVSPAGDCLAIIGSGTISVMPLRGTWLYSPMADGACFYSTDHQSCIEIDITRKWKSQLVSGADFPTLRERHQKWTGANSPQRCTFPKGAELAEFEKLRGARFRALELLGFIRFTDAAKTHWKYTLAGALRVSVFNYFIGLLRALTFGRFPKEGR